MLKAILVSFLFLVIAIALIGSTADDVTRVTQANTVTNETINLLPNRSVDLAHSQLDSFTELYNGSTLVATGAYSVDLDQGAVTLIDNTTYGPGTGFEASYVYREVGNSASRVLMNLVVTFFAIGILIFLIGLISPTFRDMLNLR